MTSARIGVARDVEYHIDHYGFRNDADYAGEPYVLVGDSFIVGSSNTQTDLLAARLKLAPQLKVNIETEARKAAA